MNQICMRMYTINTKFTVMMRPGADTLQNASPLVNANTKHSLMLCKRFYKDLFRWFCGLHLFIYNGLWSIECIYTFISIYIKQIENKNDLISPRAEHRVVFIFAHRRNLLIANGCRARAAQNRFFFYLNRFHFRNNAGNKSSSGGNSFRVATSYHIWRLIVVS